MYRRSKFLEILIAVREEMAREADYDTDLFVEIARSGNRKAKATRYSMASEESDRDAATMKRKITR
ncbi:hypothetical protein BH24ACI3_BH24ACI3_07320 [soil metagenome]